PLSPLPLRLTRGNTPPTPSPLPLPPPPLSITFANSRIVPVSNNSRKPNSTPTRSRTRATTCVASKERPPNSKKLSSTPTPSIPNTSSTIPVIISSTIVPVPSFPSPPPTLPSRSRTPPQSTFPFAVKGTSLISTQCLGIMYSGNFFFNFSRNTLGFHSLSAPTTTYATSLLSPPSSSLITTTACSTSSHSSRAPSISPSSIR